MQQNLQQKKGLVENVFNKVFDKYDLMNDLMSLGIHRVWKKELIYMNPCVTFFGIPKILGKRET